MCAILITDKRNINEIWQIDHEYHYIIINRLIYQKNIIIHACCIRASKYVIKANVNRTGGKKTFNNDWKVNIIFLLVDTSIRKQTTIEQMDLNKYIMFCPKQKKMPSFYVFMGCSQRIVIYSEQND